MSGRGVHRGIHSSLFDDPDFQLLSPDARLVLLTARLCKEAGPAVIFRYYPEVICRQTGLNRRRLKAALEELAKGNWAYSDEHVIWVRNGLRYDPNLRLVDKKHAASVKKQLEGLPKSDLKVKFCDYYKIARPFQDLAEVLPSAPPNPNTESEYRIGGPSQAQAPTEGSPSAISTSPVVMRGSAALGWASVRKALAAGASTLPPFRDERVPRVLEAMGGWEALRRLQHRDTPQSAFMASRREFTELYEAMQA